MNRKELAKLLEIEGIPSTMYSLCGDFFTPNRIVLYENHAKWEVYYIDERGGRTLLISCMSEDAACAYIHQKMINQMPREKQIYFSQPPKLWPHIIGMLHKKSILEILIRIWIDSIIYDGALPENVNVLIFEYDGFIDRYIVRFWGANQNSPTEGTVDLSMSFIPFHDNISIGIELVDSDFDKEFSDIISRLKKEKDNTAYKDFFGGKSIYVGFENNLHIV